MSTAQSVEELCSLSTEGLGSPHRWRHSEHPVQLIIGRGALAQLLAHPRLPALVIGTENSVARSGLNEAISQNKSWHVFNRIRPNPTPQVIEDAAAYAKQNGIETIVGLGGGSALDSARCVSLMLGHTSSVKELQSQIKSGSIRKRHVDLIQVPTTAGTGAEVTPWASVWSEAGKKSSVDHPLGFADLAYIDPSLTDSMPPRLTAAVGLDAMTHAMEALWGRHGDAFSDQLASQALALLQAHLPTAISSPTQDARDAMSLGALLAGMALSRTRSAIAHALSYQLTGEYQVDHGLAVGLIALAVFKLPENEAPPKRAHVVRACQRQNASQVVDMLEAIFNSIGMTTSLAQLGVPKSALDDIVETAIVSNRLGNMSGTWNRAKLAQLLGHIR